VQGIRKQDWPLLRSIGSGLWRTGRGFIWSDETKINRFGSDGREWVWKQAGEGLIEGRCRGQSSLVEETSWYGFVWDGMEWAILQRVEGRRMDADQYVSIMEDHMLPSLDESEICKEGGDFPAG